VSDESMHSPFLIFLGHAGRETAVWITLEIDV